MKKLEKHLIENRDSIQERWQTASTDLEIAIDAYNSGLEALWAPVETALDTYNEVISDANSWQQDCAASIQEYMDERSEKWQESEKGQEYNSWREEFEQEIQSVELEKPSELAFDVEDVAELLGNLNEGLGE